MPAPLPFSVTPDAADFITARMMQIQAGEEPVIVLATSLGQLPTRRGKKTDDWYQGENFIIVCFDPKEKPPVERGELLGRPVAITLDALKRLKGKTLALRRVERRDGWMSHTMHVLVTAASSEEIQHIKQQKNPWRTVSIALFVILGGFTGVGITWFVFAILALATSAIFQISLEKPFNFLAHWLYPIFGIGGILGAIGAFIFSRRVFKLNGRTRFAQEKLERKYFGTVNGLQNEWAILVFFGTPIPIIAGLVLLVEQWMRTVEEKTAAAVIILMVILAACFILCERLPRRLVFSLGFLGWLISLAIGWWLIRADSLHH